MKLTWTFYPKNSGSSVTLTVVYVPELDKHQLETGGYLDAQNTIAYVDWPTYKRFDDASVEGRKDAFQRLTVLSEGDGIVVKFLNK